MVNKFFISAFCIALFLSVSVKTAEVNEDDIKDLEAKLAALKEKKEQEERTDEQVKKEIEERLRKELEEKMKKEKDEEMEKYYAHKERLKQKALEEEKLRKEQEERIKNETPEEKAIREADELAKKEAAEKAKKEAEEAARRETLERVRKETEERIKKELEERARVESEEKTRLETEARARQEAETVARVEAETKARLEAETIARSGSSGSEYVQPEVDYKYNDKATYEDYKNDDVDYVKDNTYEKREETEEEQIRREWEKQVENFFPTDLLTIKMKRHERFWLYEKIEKPNQKLKLAYYVNDETSKIDMEVRAPSGKRVFIARDRIHLYAEIDCAEVGLYEIVLKNFRGETKKVTVGTHQDVEEKKVVKLEHLQDLHEKIRKIEHKVGSLKMIEQMITKRIEGHFDSSALSRQ